MTTAVTPTPAAEPTTAPAAPAPAVPVEEKSLLDVAESKLAKPAEQPPAGTEKAPAEAAKAPAEGEKKTEASKEQKPQGAPEKYTDFTLPEGVKLDGPVVEQFTAVAKELNLTQEQAQKLVDLQSQNAKAHNEALIALHKQTVSNWKKETIQSVGADYEERLAPAALAMQRFGSPELKQLFNDTGIANHKAMVSFLIKLGEGISEDTIVEGKGAPAAHPDAAKRMYPNMN